MQRCVACTACSRAREKQKGPAYWRVRIFAGGRCPYCRADEKVKGKKALDPGPDR